MKYKLFRREFQTWKNEINLLPTIKVVINNMIYYEKNFSIEFHFLIFHSRLLWLKEGVSNGTK